VCGALTRLDRTDRQIRPLIWQRAAERLAWQGWGGKGVGVGLGRRKSRFFGVGKVREVLRCGQMLLVLQVHNGEWAHRHGKNKNRSLFEAIQF